MSTLVLHTQGTHLDARGQRLRATTPDGLVREIPLLTVDRVFIYGKVQVSTPAIHLLAGAGKDLVYFSRRGRLRARLVHNPSFGVAVRRAQYRLADDAAASLALARSLTATKIANQRAVLLRAWRGRNESGDPILLERLAVAEARCAEAPSCESLGGIEGSAARDYFAAWAALLPVFPWNGRNRRPPRDPLNVLLSFGYTLLVNEVISQSEALGLDVWLGFLHAERPGRPALACDLMEPWRTICVDRLILDLVGHHRLGPEHFEIHTAPREADPEALDDPDADPGDGPLPRLTTEGLKRFLVGYEKRMAHGDEDLANTPRGQLSEAIRAFASALREGQTAALTFPTLRT